jgi:RNA-binding protein PNO1
MNTSKRCVELRTNKETKSKQNIQKAADFLKSFMLGFDLSDAIAMLRLDDLYLETFEIKDGKQLDLEKNFLEFGFQS